mgnify:CR=1 FL=1
MDKQDRIDLFLEKCYLPGKVDGVKQNMQEVQFPFCGITGFGDEKERNGHKSTWINGQIISPNFIRNDNCAGLAHIDGIVTDEGQMKFVESAYDFPGYHGDCFEYRLNAKAIHTKLGLEFKGEVFSHMKDSEYNVVKAGEVYLAVNPYWRVREFGGKSASHSLPFYNRRSDSGSAPVPAFWEEFLGQIEEQGYDHPYKAITDDLKKDRSAMNEREDNIPVLTWAY